MSTLPSARSHQPVRLKVTLLSLPPRTQAVLEYFFAGAGRSAFVPSAETIADAAIFDHDNPESRRHWEAFHQASGRPGILLSVQAQDVPDTVWVQKPATPAALVGAAARLTSGELQRQAEPAAVVATRAPAVAVPAADASVPQGQPSAPQATFAPQAAQAIQAAQAVAAVAPVAPPVPLAMAAPAAVPVTSASAASPVLGAGVGGPAATTRSFAPHMPAPAPAPLAPEPVRPVAPAVASSAAMPLNVASLASLLPPTAAAAEATSAPAPAAAADPAPATVAAAPPAARDGRGPADAQADAQAAPAAAAVAVADPPAKLAEPEAGPAAEAPAHSAPPAAAPHPRVSLLDPLDEHQIFGDAVAAAQQASAAGGRGEPQQALFSTKGTLLEVVCEALRVARKWNGLTQLDTPAGLLIIDAPANRAFLGFDPARLDPMCQTPLAEPLRVQMLTPRDLARMKEEPGRLVVSEHADALVWRIAVLTSRGRLPLGTNTDVMLYLRRWPNITRLPHTPEALRLSALLAVRGASLLEAVRVLGIPQRYVFATYTALAALDLVTQDGSHLKRRQRKGPKNRTLISRLFRWLSGKG